MTVIYFVPVVDRGEYWCPLCRQLANSVLPLSPELEEHTTLVISQPTSLPAVVTELIDFLIENRHVSVRFNCIILYVLLGVECLVFANMFEYAWLV